MPVLSIPEANELISAGELDGRVAAVRGYWLPPLMSCKRPPDRWYAPLESYCGYNTFSETPFEPYSCQDTANGGSDCHLNTWPPEPMYMTPQVLDDEIYTRPLYEAAYYGDKPDGAPAIVVGHVVDPGYFLCPTSTREDCRKTFVVDRIPWLDGKRFDSGPYDDPTWSPMLSPAEVSAAIGDSALLMAVPMKAANVARVDPRLARIGDSIVWFVRSLRANDAAAESGATRAVDEWLVDDTTGSVIGQSGLELDADYDPGFIRVQATWALFDPNARQYPYYRIDAADGAGVEESFVDSGVVGGTAKEGLQYWPGLPAVLEPGDYRLSAWLASRDDPKAASSSCATDIAVSASDDQRLEAAFDVNGSCEWREPTFTDSW